METPDSTYRWNYRISVIYSKRLGGVGSGQNHELNRIGQKLKITDAG